MCAADSKQRYTPNFLQGISWEYLPDGTALEGNAAVSAAATVPFMKSLRFILFVIRPICIIGAGPFSPPEGRCFTQELRRKRLRPRTFYFAADRSLLDGNADKRCISKSNRGRGSGVCQMGPVHLARPRLKLKTLFHLYFLSAVRQEPDSNCNNTDNHQKSDRIT
jgi:hypothetical protein